MRLVIIVLMVTATPHYTKILALAQECWGQILLADLTQTFNF
ncbi:hypothetical protein [Helicobacter pylori]|nr:hypothetical protein [Helicobacter pylori]